MNVEVSFTPDQNDAYSKEVCFSVTITNNGNEEIEVQSISLRLPEDVFVQETFDSSKQRHKVEYDDICDHIEQMINTFLLRQSSEYRKASLEAIKEDLEKIFNASGIIRTYMMMLFTNKDRLEKFIAPRSKAIRIEIKSSDDATKAYNRFIKDNISETVTRDIINSKIERLQFIESLYNGNFNAGAMALISPNEKYSRTFIFTGKRSASSSRTFNIIIDCSVKERVANKEPVTISRGASFTLTANPVSLTLIAVISSVGGTILKALISLPQQSGKGVIDILPEIFSGRGPYAAMITSIIAYNIYDNLDFSQKVKIGSGWRNALFVGAVCGLFNERVYAAIAGLLG